MLKEMIFEYTVLVLPKYTFWTIES